MGSHRKKVGIIYRYGVVDHIELYPIIPDLLRELGSRADVFYIGPNRAKIGKQHHYPGVQYVHIPFRVERKSFREKLLKALLWYLYLPFIALYCRFKKMDIIWIDESSLPTQARIVQVFSGCRVAQTVCDFFIDIYKEQSLLLRSLAGLLDRIDRHSWKKSAGIFTRTDAMRQYLKTHDVPCEVQTVRDAVLPDLFIQVNATALRSRLGYSKDDVVLCHHGILHPNKGIPLFLDYLADYFPNHPNLKFLIIGDGPARSDVESKITRHAMQDRVIMTGWLSDHEQVNQHLCAADIGLVMRLAEFHDHFHVTGACVHCMMAQLPVLSVNLRGVMEIIQNGEEGYIFDPNDKNSLFSQLDKLLDNKDERIQMGLKGRKKALAMFNPHDIAIQTAELIMKWAR